MDPGEFDIVERKEGRLMSVMEPGEFDIVGMRGRLMSAMEPGDLDIVERRGPQCSCQPALFGTGRLQLLLKILIHSRGGIEIFGQPISLGTGHLRLSLGGGRRSYAAKGLSQVFVCLVRACHGGHSGQIYGQKPGSPGLAGGQELDKRGNGSLNSTIEENFATVCHGLIQGRFWTSAHTKFLCSPNHGCKGSHLP
ncbi:uncharacterized protein ASPGLDRAFT_23427 [Aspergillus glaucus CBS 516.65]|uniref:Uncharacterized protein n=1 Tax=Aspergillus glaucus CBS 516.65 TaxID=1160497 RepID=A0A1L9VU10_ASPGL|nr:hypothetical protein ASPGLDRAFT_23427 [Aspergillus glaucus CBS 516.65]OJJ87418.1 hypothetical protein ASPGLDRAFT_23427 [Aspergillus glaucus CBS 516.65]